MDDPAIGDRMGLDIGPKTVEAYAAALSDAKTVVWNGPMGVFEIDAFATGTMAVAEAVARVNGTTIVGGGDSIAAIKKSGVSDRITHISTGGGRVARVPRRPDVAGSCGATRRLIQTSSNSLSDCQLERGFTSTGSGRLLHLHSAL